ncbi:MAG: tRNA (adenosine(37)-N6)-threonylcarbamoyltransferase complex transferase subunit TsaD [Candidatus Marisimplicoccus sp.]
MSKEDIYILGIESSCDDTAAAVLKNDEVLSNCISNQEIHKKYGGVVPELASRAHLSNIIPVVSQALSDAKVNTDMLSAIAFTKGPGLIGSLLVGTEFSKALGLSLDIPVIEVNHMQAHLLVHYIKCDRKKPKFPFLGITVSGGHTQLVIVEDHLKMEIIGETLDDAIGEAFDKCGKIIGLDYPAGPEIDNLAKKGDSNKFDFPIPKVEGFDISYSGTKTAFMNFINNSIQKDPEFIKRNKADICASIQKNLIDNLILKIEYASKIKNINRIVIGGGVSANSFLKDSLELKSKENNWELFIPPLSYTTDNAAMIGVVGYLKYISGLFSNYNTIASPRLAFK